MITTSIMTTAQKIEAIRNEWVRLIDSKSPDPYDRACQVLEMERWAIDTQLADLHQRNIRLLAEAQRKLASLPVWTINPV
jgi:hypothetical protein